MTNPVFFDNAWRDADGRAVAAPERTYDSVSKEIRNWLEKAHLNLNDHERYQICMDRVTALEAERDAVRAKMEGVS